MATPDANRRRADDGSPRLLTTAQVAALCQLSEKTIYRAIARGTLRACRLGRGGGFRIWVEDMERWVDSTAVARANPEPRSPDPDRTLRFQRRPPQQSATQADGRLRLEDA
jgi:excisionase family DNA binding protein